MNIKSKYDDLYKYSRIRFTYYTIELYGEKISVNSNYREIPEHFIKYAESIGLVIDSITPGKDRIFFKVREGWN